MDLRKFADSFMEKNAFARFLGMVVTDVGEGFAKGEIPIKEEYSNYSNTLHGAVYFALADTLAGIASKTYGNSSVTLEGKMNFIRAAKKGKITGEVYAIRHGKTVSVYEAKVYDDENNIVATASYTFYMLDRKIEI